MKLTFKDFKDDFLRGSYFLVGAKTGKTVYQSWRNKETKKFDDCIVTCVWSEIRVIESPFGDFAKPVTGIYLLGL